jgi:23S rRNA (guanosine2251-2'-O)-methyltransferase
MITQDEQPLRIEGRNAVMEALNSNRGIDKIFIKKGAAEGSLKVIAAKARERGIIISEADSRKLDELSGRSRAHQGVIAVCPAYAYAEVDDILNKAREAGEPPFIVILDGIEDPHNLGAVIRTADAAGAHGVIIPKRRATGITPAAVKASAGAVEHVPVARVTNLTSVIENLKNQNIWTFCADPAGEPLYDAPLSGAIAVIIGSEGAGVSRIVRETCDFAVSIPMFGKIPSLNASVCAAVIMYEAVRRRAGAMLPPPRPTA